MDNSRSRWIIWIANFKTTSLIVLPVLFLSACSTLLPTAPSNVKLSSASQNVASDPKPQKVSVANSPQPKRTVEKPKEPARANDWIQQSQELYQEQFSEKPTPSDAKASRSTSANTSKSKGEWFIDFYIGPAWTHGEGVSTIIPGTPFFVVVDGDTDTAVSFGSRFGHWFKPYPYLGLAVDISHFQPKETGIEVKITEITLDFMVRHFFLKDDGFPNGKVQPYLTIGPGFSINHGELNAFGFEASDTATSFGFKIAPGVALLFRPNAALFVEYRFTHFSPEFDLFGADLDVDLDTHRLLFGLSYRF